MTIILNTIIVIGMIEKTENEVLIGKDSTTKRDASEEIQSLPPRSNNIFYRKKKQRQK